MRIADLRTIKADLRCILLPLHAMDARLKSKGAQVISFDALWPTVISLIYGFHIIKTPKLYLFMIIINILYYLMRISLQRLPWTFFNFVELKWSSQKNNMLICLSLSHNIHFLQIKKVDKFKITLINYLLR